MSPYFDFVEALRIITSLDQSDFACDQKANARATIEQILRENPEGLLVSIQNRDADAEKFLAIQALLR